MCTLRLTRRAKLCYKFSKWVAASAAANWEIGWDFLLIVASIFFLHSLIPGSVETPQDR